MNDSERIKKVVDYTGLSTKRFAESIGLQRVDRIYNVLKGRNNISNSLAKLITTKYNKINFNWLLEGTGEMIKRNVEQYPCPGVSEDSPYNSVMLVPLVQQYAYGGYLSGFADEEYLAELPKIPFLVDREYHGNYVCFEIKGDSMDDGSRYSYEEGDIVLCREINPIYWTSRLHFKEWNAFVIVHRTDGVIIKRIVDHDVEKGIITIHSLNPLYPDRKIDLREVSKLFNVVKSQRNR